MRSLIDAALEDQARRVIESRPAALPSCHSATAVPPCLNCGGIIRAYTTHGTPTGYCCANPECRKLGKAVAMERYRLEHPRPVKVKPAPVPAPEPQFCGHCKKRLDVHGRRTTSGYCRTGPCRYQRVLELQAHRRAANLGTQSMEGKGA